MIIKVVLSTASIERVRILDLLLNAGGQLSTSQIEVSLNISKPTARRTMAEFKGLGIVDIIEGEYENSEIKIKLKSKFSWFLSSEFKALREDFTPNFENEIKSPSLLKEKYPPSDMEDHRYQNIDDKKIQQNLKAYECYYCSNFPSTTNKADYERHVVLNHHNKMAYPSKTDLEKNNLKPQGKRWEV